MAAHKISKQKKIAHVLAYLGKNRLMTLGTAEKGKPWAATVFYAYDKDLNVLFYSPDYTRHCRHIKENTYVSVVINHDWRNSDGTIKGLQMRGRARRVSRKDYPTYYLLYKSRFSWADEFASDHKLYIVKPIELWYIDQKLFGHVYRERIL